MTTIKRFTNYIPYLKEFSTLDLQLLFAELGLMFTSIFAIGYMFALCM